jgi:hypothetical protein
VGLVSEAVARERLAWDCFRVPERFNSLLFSRRPENSTSDPRFSLGAKYTEYTERDTGTGMLFLFLNNQKQMFTALVFSGLFVSSMAGSRRRASPGPSACRACLYCKHLFAHVRTLRVRLLPRVRG